MAKVKNLIIIAGGTATRLEKYHQNLIPKILLNINDETILFKMIKAWSDHVENIHIVVKSQSEEEQIQKYLACVLPENLHNVKTYVKSERFHTMHKLNHVAKEISGDAYITWSDIYPTEIPVRKLSGNYIFTDNNKIHRFDFNGIDINKSEAGNICGMFYVKDANELKSVYASGKSLYRAGRINKNIDELDFVDVLKEVLQFDENHYGNWSAMDIDIVDIGDETKYEKALELEKFSFNKTRFFNSITFNREKNIVEKTATTKTGIDVLINETGFYDFINKQSRKLSSIFPPFLDYFTNRETSTLTIGFIEGKTVFETIKTVDSKYENLKLANQIFLDFYMKMKTLHDPMLLVDEIYISEEDFQQAMKYEYVDVTAARLKKVQPFINNIGLINGKEVEHSSIYDLISQIKTVIDKKCQGQNTLALIHGDPNTSNVMYEENHNLRLIDPRGTFGGLSYFGDAKYDLAKFLYGLTGYDSFNTAINVDLKSIKMQDGSLAISYKLPPHYDLDELTDDVETKLLVSIIWLKLSAYIANYPLKSIVAFCHGVTLFQKYSKLYLNNQQ